MKTIAALALALSATLPATAADTIQPGPRLAASCAGCHGTNGATQGNALPPLAGQPKDQLLAALKDFKAGKRPATIMTLQGRQTPRHHHDPARQGLH